MLIIFFGQANKTKCEIVRSNFIKKTILIGNQNIEVIDLVIILKDPQKLLPFENPIRWNQNFYLQYKLISASRLLENLNMNYPNSGLFWNTNLMAKPFQVHKETDGEPD